jgi:hypothetical protein
MTRDFMTIGYVAAIGMATIAVLMIAKKGASALGSAASSIGSAVNPLSQNNIFYKGANSVVQSIAGPDAQRADVSLGTWLADTVENLSSAISGQPTPGQVATAPSTPDAPAAGANNFPAPSIAVGRIGNVEIGV